MLLKLQCNHRQSRAGEASGAILLLQTPIIGRRIPQQPSKQLTEKENIPPSQGVGNTHETRRHVDAERHAP
jgi:hypothetical protein